jgi:hypothetical protein
MKSVLNFSLVIKTSTSCHFTSSNSQSFTLSQMYLYQKVERALPGNVQSRKIFFRSPLNAMSLTPPSHIFLLFFSSSVFKGLTPHTKKESWPYA